MLRLKILEVASQCSVNEALELIELNGHVNSKATGIAGNERLLYLMDTQFMRRI